MHIRRKDDVGLLNLLKLYSNKFAIPRRCFFFASFLLLVFYGCLYYTVLSVPCRIVIICWESSYLSALWGGMFSCVFVTFLHGVSGQVWYATVSIHDLFALYSVETLFIISRPCLFGVF